jgi:hypothetical protein
VVSLAAAGALAGALAGSLAGERVREGAVRSLNQRLAAGVDLRSRRGIDDALWKILVLSLIAALAAGILFPLGPKLLELGRNTVTKIQAPPW